MSKPKEIANQEHHEAEQVEANRKRDVFIATLPKSEQAKFAAVEKAVRLLIKADVPFYIFPLLQSFQFEGKQEIWQWNSLGAKMQYDNRGKSTEKSNKENSLYHEAFFSSFLNVFGNFFKGESVEVKLTNLPYFFHYCMTKYNAYLDDAEESKQDEN